MSSIPTSPPPVDAMVMLCDAAQVVDSKLYILGGGIHAVGPRPQPLSVAIRIEVPWDRANISHHWRLDLLDQDGHQVPSPENPVHVAGRFEAGRPAGARPGHPLGVPLAINFATLPLEPGQSYTWQLSIDEQTRLDWRTSFFVRPQT
ncbi:MAG: hypothetical protein OES57_02215 [Acidimicrobiia bacterium]|nr:hypothetical protein [Acidimicrobiia bacterium]